MNREDENTQIDKDKDYMFCFKCGQKMYRDESYKEAIIFNCKCGYSWHIPKDK